MHRSSLTRRSFIRTFGDRALGGALPYAFSEDVRAKYIISSNEAIVCRYALRFT